MAKRMRTGNPQRGFGYVFLLMFIAVLGYMSAYALQVGHLASRRLAEQELLNIGYAFEAALYSYAGIRPPATNSPLPPGALAVAGPGQLEDLIKDPRVPGLRRHIRKLYPDPVSGKAEWGLIRDQAGHIVGIHSLSSDTPIKKTGFDAAHTHLEDAARYRDWRFGLPVSEVLNRAGSPSP